MYTIAIVGRPNVGKSTLFNKMIKKRKAIVAKESGVTRDFQTEAIYSNDKAFTVIDTSGYEIDKQDELRPYIDKQYDSLLSDTDAFLFVCDGQTAITQLDHDLQDKIRKLNKPTLSVVNKIDTNYFKHNESEFFEFFGSSFEKISAERGEGIRRLFDKLDEAFTLTKSEKPVEPRKISVVLMGRPNVGKSTLMNHLCKKERSIASPIPGTTRDPIDSVIQHEDQTFVFVDTAGLRKRKNVTELVEAVSNSKGVTSLERSDLLLLLIDATQGPKDQDIKITSLAWQRGVGVILLINKWDLLSEDKRNDTYWLDIIGRKFRSFDKIPFLFISATQNRNLHKIYDVIQTSFKSHEQVVDQYELQVNFMKWVQKMPPPLHKLSKNKRVRLKFYSCVQVDHAPPVFRVRTNYPKGMPKSYDLYLKNQLRETFGFWGIPIKIKYYRIN